MDREYQDTRDFEYRAGEPLQDRRNHPAQVREGYYPRLMGIDGRHVGSFRRFPGFRPVLDIRDYDVASAGDVAAVADADQQIWFFRYVAVQVAAGEDTWFTEENEPYPQLFAGAHERTLRGFVVAHKYDVSGTDYGVLRFIYYNEESAAWVSRVLLREVPGLPTDPRTQVQMNNPTIPPTIDGSAQIDVCAMGPFIYFCVDAGTRKGHNGPEPSEPKAWDHDSVGYRRDCQVRSVRVVSTGAVETDLAFHFTDFGPPYFLTETATDWTDDSAVPVKTANTVQDLVPAVKSKLRLSARMVSRFKNVAGPLLPPKDVDGGGAGTYYWKFDKISQAYLLVDLEALGVEDHLLAPAIQAYRTIDSYWFEDAGIEIPGTIMGGTLFREREFRIAPDDDNLPAPNPDGEYCRGMYDYGGDPAVTSLYIAWGAKSDIVLAQGAPRINPFLDDTAFSPKIIRFLLPYQGTLLRVGTMPRPMPPATINDRGDVLSWGSLLKYAPEESRVVDATPLGAGQDEHILGLVGAGDYAFVIGDSSVFRVHRNGQVLYVNEIQTLAGGVSRFGAIGIGTSLYYLNPTGLYVVDGAANRYQLVTAFDRIVLEDWKDTLPGVRMAYDLRLGALMILNSDLSEMALLWNNTGAITGLTGCPFVHGTQGVNPEDAEASRSYWVTQRGIVFTPNATRESSQPFTMCGGKANDTSYIWNGTAAGGTEAGLTITGATPFNYEHLLGFEVHFTSGNNAGASRVISSATGTTLGWDTWLTYAVAAGDKFSVAPVVFEVVGWPLQAAGVGPDQFIRKNIVGMGHAARALGGATTRASNPNIDMQHRIYRRGDLSAAVVSATAIFDENPSKCFSYPNVAGPVLLPAWRHTGSNLDFEWLGGVVCGKITCSAAESAGSVQGST